MPFTQPVSHSATKASSQITPSRDGTVRFRTNGAASGVGGPAAAARTVSEAAVMGRVEELLQLFGLEPFADNLVSELSTGSRRLVDLAAVVAHQPSVILLDEPSSGVAQREVEAMASLLRSVRDRLDATVLVVEHDIAFIARLADRLVAMDRGSVLVSGTPGEVLTAPEVGESFLGSDPLATSRSGPAGEVEPA